MAQRGDIVFVDYNDGETSSGALRFNPENNTLYINGVPISGGGGTPGGSNGQLQYNNAGAFGGIANGAAGTFLVSAGGVLPAAFAASPIYSAATGDVSFTAGFVRAAHPPTESVPPAPGAAADDEFAEAALDTGGTRFPGAIPWGWVNQGPATTQLSSGILTMIIPSVAGDNFRFIAQAIDNADTVWKFRAKCTAIITDAADTIAFGIVTQNSVSEEIAQLFQLYYGNQFLYADNRASPTSGGGSTIGSIILFLRFFPLYFEVERAGDVLSFRVSYAGTDGSFTTVGVASIAAVLSGVLDRVGLVGYNNNGNDLLLSWDWFRRVA